MSFPIYLSSFIGRQNETSELQSILREKSTRLLTITGPGGSGKTRLTAEIIPSLKDTFEDGLVWIELAGLSDPTALPQTVAAALGVNAVPGQSPTNTLITTLQPRETLIILDNCEHLWEACAQLVTSLLQACPALYWMATSRQPLGVEGEQRWPMPPLSYPTEREVTPDALSNFEAVQLFAARAKQVHPAFRIHANNGPALLSVSQLLEGMPLAIELAASWVNILEVEEIANRLENQLALLTKRDSAAVTRHRSMRATIHWSYELLSEREQTLFRRLGVFVGGFSLKAVEAVCEGGGLAQADILPTLAHLVDQSLVVKEQGTGKEGRYRQLEAIRQFACEQLEASGEKESRQDQHLQFFTEWTREAEPHLLGPEQRQWTERLDTDHENLQAALAWACQEAMRGQEKATTSAISLTLGLFWFWNYTDRHETGRGWDEKVLGLPLPRTTSETADLLRHRATFTWLVGDYPATKRQLQESLQVAETIGYTFCQANAKMLLGILALHQGNADDALGLLQESEQLFQKLGSGRELIIVQTNLGGAFLELGLLEKAGDFTGQAVARARANHDLWGLGLSLSGLGEILFKEGEHQAAIQNMNLAIEALQQIGQQWLLAEAYWRLANMFEALEDFEQAEKQLERCFALAQDGGALQWEIAALESLGRISIHRGNDPQAAGYFERVLQLTPRQAFISLQLRTIAGIVHLATRAQQWPQATALWEAYEAIKIAHSLSDLPEESTLRTSLAPHLPISAVARVRPPTLPDTVRLALEMIANLKSPRVTIASTHDLRLLALGPAEVYLRDQLLVASDWTFAKPKELLFYLASNPPKTKEQIGLVFWPDASPAQLRVSLRAALYHLRRTLEARDWILYENGTYRFNRELNYWYDVEAFETGLVEAENARSQVAQIEKYERAVRLFRGEFLEGITFDEWGTLRREELARKYRVAMNALAVCHLDQTSFDRALEVYHTLLKTDPLHEETHRGAMRAYARKGEIALALRHYQDLVRLLQDELGAPPSPTTQTLYQRLQRGEKI